MTSNRTQDSEFSLRAALWDLRDSFTDVSLVCRSGPGGQNNVLRCHKVVLAASSSYFMKMFSLRNRDEVHLPKVDFNVMLNLVEFIYTGQAPKADQDHLEFVRLGQELSVKGLPMSGPLQDVPTGLPEASLGRKQRQDDKEDEIYQNEVIPASLLIASTQEDPGKEILSSGNFVLIIYCLDNTYYS